jgi:hypothetical protein
MTRDCSEFTGKIKSANLFHWGVCVQTTPSWIFCWVPICFTQSKGSDEIAVRHYLFIGETRKAVWSSLIKQSHSNVTD